MYQNQDENESLREIRTDGPFESRLQDRKSLPVEKVHCMFSYHIIDSHVKLLLS